MKTIQPIVNSDLIVDATFYVVRDDLDGKPKLYTLRLVNFNNSEDRLEYSNWWTTYSGPDTHDRKFCLTPSHIIAQYSKTVEDAKVKYIKDRATQRVNQKKDMERRISLANQAIIDATGQYKRFNERTEQNKSILSAIK